jgi:hypothetical protein
MYQVYIFARLYVTVKVPFYRQPNSVRETSFGKGLNNPDPAEPNFYALIEI